MKVRWSTTLHLQPREGEPKGTAQPDQRRRQSADRLHRRRPGRHHPRGSQLRIGRLAVDDLQLGRSIPAEGRTTSSRSTAKTVARQEAEAGMRTPSALDSRASDYGALTSNPFVIGVLLGLGTLRPADNIKTAA